MTTAAHRGEHSSRRIVATLARVSVAALVLGYLLTRIDLGRVAGAVQDAPVSAVLEAFVLCLLGWWIISYRLAIFMRAQGTRVDTFEALQINLAALFYGLLLPGGDLTGLAVRIHRLARASRHYAAGILATAADRLASTAAVWVTGLACWALDAHDKPAAALAALLVGAVMVTATIAPFAAWGQRRRLARVFGLRDSAATSGALRRVAEELDVIVHLPARTIALLVILSCVSQVPGILGYVVLAHALGLPLPLVTLGWVRSTVMIVTALPISVAGLGVREGLLVLVLRPYGVADHDALALSFLVFAVTIVGAGLVGGILEAVRWLTPRAWTPSKNQTVSAGEIPTRPIDP